MKKSIKLFLALITMFLLSLSLFACSGSGSGSGGGYPGGSMSPDSSGDGYEGGSSEDSGEIEDSPSKGDIIFDITQEELNQIQAGQITAMEWSDCEHYTDWLELVASGNQTNGEDGQLATAYKSLQNINSNLNTQNIIVFKLTSGENVLTNAKIKIITPNQQVMYESVTNMNGLAYIQLIDYYSSITVAVEYYGQTFSQVLELKGSERLYNINLENVVLAEKPKTLDLLLTIDTTGSMGDEIKYLQAELKNVISRLDGLNMNIRLALLFYRDLGDSYVTLDFDFTTNIDAQINNLSKQKASGGGDWEEAVDIAYDEATKLNWSEDSIKIMFHVADAPPHFTQSKIGLFVQSVQKFSKLGIRLVPITCSGIESKSEVLYRIAAMLTGGTYTYITDHSGIGNDHHESITGATVVELLNEMMIRIITEYCTGEDIPPVSYIKRYIAELTFDSNGGSFVNSIFILKGKTVSMLQKPVKENHKFLGWYYLDNGVEVEFTLQTVVNSDLLIYAKWKEIVQEGSN